MTTAKLTAAVLLLSLAASSQAALPVPGSANASSAALTKKLEIPGCVDGIGRPYIFEGHLVGQVSEKTVDMPRQAYLFLSLKAPIAVCGYHFAGVAQPAYRNVRRILISIMRPHQYQTTMKRFGGTTVLINAELFNTEFTGHGGGPVIFDKIKQFCYSKPSEGVFRCMAWKTFPTD